MKLEDLTFEDIFESLPVGVFLIDNDGKIVSINRRQEDVSKVGRNILEGKYLHEEFKVWFEDTQTKKLYERLLKEKIPYSHIYHEVDAKFHKVKFTGKGYAVPLESGKGFIMVNDLSEEIRKDRHTLEQLNIQLSQSTAFLKNLLDSSPNAILTINKDNLIESSNATAEKLFGFSKAELSWKPVIELMMESSDQIDLEALSKKEYSTEATFKTADGTTFPARIRMTDIKEVEFESSSRLLIIEDIRYEKSIEYSLAERLQFERLLSKLFSTFVNIQPNEIRQKIDQALEQIGSTLRIDRCHLFQYDSSEENYQITYSWTANNTNPVPIGTGVEEFPWLFEGLKQKKVVQLQNVGEIPESAIRDRKTYDKYQIKSQLNIPLIHDQVLAGCFSLDQVQSERIWMKDLVTQLKIVGEVLLNVLLKKRSEEILQQAYLEIKHLKNELEKERNYLREEIKLVHNYENIIGESQSLQYALFKVEQVSITDSTVLLLGETGTGKELLARAVHSKSKRKDQPLIKVDCAALHSNIIESELFGHEKGAFTGAHSRRIGRFEVANGATIFLDEIGELPMETQGKLLRVLQDGEFERLGSSETIKVDVRVIAATNRNLEEEVANGSFRRDLWYRLNIFPITSPPLRRRKEDIPFLANWLMEKYAKRMGKNIEGISTNTMKALESYHWPGNVRELENVIERAIITSHGRVLDIGEKLETELIEPIPEKKLKTLSEIECSYIIEVLEQTRWQIEGRDGAALILGLTPSSLRRRLTKYNIQRP